MPSPADWSNTLAMIESHTTVDPRTARHIHRFLIELELAVGDVPRVRLARAAWRTLERALIEESGASVERERRLCIEALELAIETDPETRDGGAQPSNENDRLA